MITRFAVALALLIFSANSPGEVPEDRLRGDLSDALDALGDQEGIRGSKGLRTAR
jgi:hypothetical protein